MDNFFKNRIITLTINAIFCIITAWCLFLFIKNIFDKQKQIDDIKSRIEMLKNNSEIIKNQTKKLNALTDQQEKLSQIILTKESAPGFFSILESIAEKNNIKINISSVNDVVKNNIKTLNMDVHLTGDLNSIQNFYQAIESLPVQIRIDSLLITREEKGSAPIVGNVKNPAPQKDSWASQSSLVVLSY